MLLAAKDRPECLKKGRFFCPIICLLHFPVSKKHQFRLFACKFFFLRRKCTLCSQFANEPPRKRKGEGGMWRKGRKLIKQALLLGVGGGGQNPPSTHMRLCKALSSFAKACTLRPSPPFQPPQAMHLLHKSVSKNTEECNATYFLRTHASSSPANFLFRKEC